MIGVAAGKSGFVAVGHVSTGESESARVSSQQAAAWTSGDGRRWQRVPNTARYFGEQRKDTFMSAVVAGGPGFVAVGGENLGQDKGRVAAVWTSTDGRAWTRGSHEPVFGQRGADLAAMRAITAGPTGLVAVGESLQGAAAWTSRNGRSWQRASLGEPNRVSLLAVTHGPRGFVAVGHDELSKGNYVATAWTSKNGTEWTRVAHDDAVFGANGGQTIMKSVATTESRMVAVGEVASSNTEGPTAAVWTSTDGQSWTRLPHDNAVFGRRDGFTTMNAISTEKDGMVAVGATEDVRGGDGLNAVVWISTDGSTWSRVGHDEAVFGSQAAKSSEMWSVVPRRSTIIVAGNSLLRGTDTLVAAVWTATAN